MDIIIRNSDIKWPGFGSQRLSRYPPPSPELASELRWPVTSSFFFDNARSHSKCKLIVHIRLPEKYNGARWQLAVMSLPYVRFMDVR